MHDYAIETNDNDLLISIKKFSKKYFDGDKDCPTDYEPSGTDFLSPCLAEAEFMSKIIDKKQFSRWLKSFFQQLCLLYT